MPRTTKKKSPNAVTLTEMSSAGSFSGSYLARGHDRPFNFSASFDLFLIRNAWDKGADFEDLADGYGAGQGTHGDWSGIRDSSPAAKLAMLERAINHLGLSL